MNVIVLDKISTATKEDTNYRESKKQENKPTQHKFL